MTDPEVDTRPWDDPDDPKPSAFDAEGRWTAEFIEWAKRSGKRRANFMADYSGREREQASLSDSSEAPRD